MVFIIVSFSEHSHELLKTETTHTRNLGNIFHGDSSADDLNDIASNDELLDYDTSSSALESTLTELSTPSNSL